MAGIGGNGWEWLERTELSRMTGNCLKWLEMTVWEFGDQGIWAFEDWGLRGFQFGPAQPGLLVQFEEFWNLFKLGIYFCFQMACIIPLNNSG